MTFPTVQTTNSGFTNSSGTSHTVNLPSSIASGDLLLVLFAFKPGTSNVPSWPAGWTGFFDVENTTGGTIELVGAWRKADGTEGASITVSLSESSRMAYATYRISGAADPTTRAPEAATATLNNTTAPDPSSLTPTGGAKDYLWLAAFAASEGRITSTLPTNYTDSVGAGGDSGTISHIGVGSGRRQLNAASENPGAFAITGTATAETASATIAIHPAAAGLSGTVNQSTETDTAQAVAKVKSKGVAQNIETDLAQIVARIKQRALGLNSETDVAQAVARLKQRAVGLNGETDTAQAITSRKVLIVGQATETNTTQPILSIKRVGIAQAQETDTSQSIASAKLVAVGQVSETDSAQTISLPGAIIVAVNQVTEADTVQPIAAQKIVLISQVAESDLAQALFPSKHVALVQVLEVDSAFALAQPQIRLVQQIIETDEALHITISGFVPVAHYVYVIPAENRIYIVPAAQLETIADRTAVIPVEVRISKVSHG